MSSDLNSLTGRSTFCANVCEKMMKINEKIITRLKSIEPTLSQKANVHNEDKKVELAKYSLNILVLFFVSL